MKLQRLRSCFLLAIVGVCGSIAIPARAQVSLTALGTSYTQSFDSLPASGSATWTNNSTISGWYHARTGTGTTIVANDGSSNAGNLYSYGTGTATDRALGSVGSGNAAAGSFFWGVRLQNNTGSTITSLAISYTGEQWRNSAAAAQTVSFSYLVGNPTVTGTLAEFQTAGVAVTNLDFVSPVTGGTAGALNGNLAANRVALSFTISSLNIPNGTEFMLRWADPDHTGNDHGLSIDDLSVTPQGGASLPVLSINDVSLTEGSSGTTAFTFTVSLSQAATTPVTFDIATANGTAVAPGDYTAKSLTGQSIGTGLSTYQFTVDVIGDTTPETNETFFVNVTNVSGASVGDGQGLGTITDDDFTCTPTATIAQIQGSGDTSPLNNTAVTTTGIVTARRFNGYYIQMPLGDGDPNTSDGVFVFTSSTPPAAAAVGNSVCVSGTVQEFIPSTDLNSPSATEIANVTNLLVISTGNTLPDPVTLTAADTNPAGPINQLEKYEGMRVKVSSMNVVAPTQGTVNEANATSTSTGLFFGVIAGIPRPFREPGVALPDPLPPGSPCCVPRWDANPEIIAVDSDALIGATAIDVATGAILTNVIGPLEYARRAYTIDTEPALPPTVSNNTLAAIPVPVPGVGELTIANFNMERFFDTTNDPSVSDVVLTTTAFNNRLNKVSLAIRNVLRYPDVLGAEEVENLPTLQAIATKVNNDAVAAGASNPNYQAYLVEGNDIGGIDVGFLVKTPKVNVISVTQYGKDTTFTDPSDGSTDLLNDRPPLVLVATAKRADATVSLPFTVIVNHLRSLTDLADPVAGPRVRHKKEKQSEYLANLIQGFQSADPKANIVSVGDYNAFQFNDGYVDVMGVIKGTPVPANQVVEPTVVITNPALTDLIDTAPADQKYSYTFAGSAQEIDHILVNSNMLARLSRYAVARNDADFPDVYRSDPNRPERISDHDMPAAYFNLPTGLDISASVQVTQTGFGRNRLTGIWAADMTVTNSSGSTLTGPINVVLTSLPSTVTMTNKSGTYNGSPYITVSTGTLAPGASVTVSIQFTNPSNGFINFTPVTYAGSF